ncbi:MAG: hypothetical protein NVSMB62_04510 [Acidobacteriaceae bacterium]
MLVGAGAATGQLLFSRTLLAAEAVRGTDRAVTGPPGALDLTLTAMTPNTLCIGIAPANASAHSDELGVERTIWPRPLESSRPVRPHVVAWGEYSIEVSDNPLRVAVRERGALRQEIWFSPDSTDVHFPLRGPVFGLGEGVHPFDRRGTRDAMSNGQNGTDLRTFGARLPIPWVISPDGWGIFIGQPQGSFVFTEDEGAFRGAEATSTRNVFLLLGKGPAEVLQEYANLTGMPHMPARWTLGYQQSHRTLSSPEEVVGVTRTFREKKLPCDAVIYLGTGFCDSGWNTGHGSFTFNAKVFPNPKAIFDGMHKDHFKVILHVVPPGNFHGTLGDTGTAAASPGAAASYWAQHDAILPEGVDGWWPDEGDRLSVYARLDRNRLYFEGSRKSKPEERPFALHRNGYAGIQRYGWLWSGDTFSTWDALRAQIANGINAGLCGIPYWGTDTGGFVPTAELTPELYLRWFQWSAFCPSFRSHGRAWKLRLPWGWNTGDPGPKEVEGDWVAAWPAAADLHRPDVEQICRKYLELRYQLLPYLYSSVAQTHRTGIPLIRALCLAYPRDVKAARVEDAYMWGDHLLVAPVCERSATARSVYLPAGKWYHYGSGQSVEGGATVNLDAPLDTLPLLVRAGAIVPVGPVLQHTGEYDRSRITLRVFPGADGRFTWYEDDGISYQHEAGTFLQVECVWNDSQRTLTLITDPKGKLPLPPAVQVQMVGQAGEKRVVLTGGKTVVRM